MTCHTSGHRDDCATSKVAKIAQIWSPRTFMDGSGLHLAKRCKLYFLIWYFTAVNISRTKFVQCLTSATALTPVFQGNACFRAEYVVSCKTDTQKTLTGVRLLMTSNIVRIFAWDSSVLCTTMKLSQEFRGFPKITLLLYWKHTCVILVCIFNTISVP